MEMKKLAFIWIVILLLTSSCSKKGCMDSDAENYDPKAKIDPGACEYIFGCMDEVSTNYNSEATRDDGSCEYVIYPPPPPGFNNFECGVQGYTYSELLVLGIWSYFSLSTTGVNQASLEDDYKSSTIEFKSDSTVIFSFPNNTALNSIKKWEVLEVGPQILINKGLISEYYIDMPTLNETCLITKFLDDNKEEISVSWIR